MQEVTIEILATADRIEVIDNGSFYTVQSGNRTWWAGSQENKTTLWSFCKWDVEFIGQPSLFLRLTKSKPQLKLYVWHGILCDFTGGVGFALAESVEQARELIIAYYGDRVASELLWDDPKVYDIPYGCAYTGGG